MRMKPRIVLVEDDVDIAEALGYSLRKAGYEVAWAHNGYDALDLLRGRRPRLVVLDLMIPGIDGYEVCQQMKTDRLLREVPIIMLTARSEETDVVLGLGLGADDYVTKPFSTSELLARISAVLKRGNLSDSTHNQTLAYGDVVLDHERFEVRVGPERADLTATEFQILQFLMRHPGQAFSRDEILNHTIGDDAYVIDRNVDVHIRGIRKKLGLAELVKTIRGVGYRLDAEKAYLPKP